MDNIIHLENEVTIYTYLLCHNDNPNIDNILSAFKQVEDVLNTDKLPLINLLAKNKVAAFFQQNELYNQVQIM